MVGIETIKGGIFIDHRGRIAHVNDFTLSDVKRFYSITLSDTSIVRAWQAHKAECKWFYVIQGSIGVACVTPDNWEHPSDDLEVQKFILTSHSSEILHVSGGYANGFKALEPNSIMVVFSNFSVEESKNDDYRFEQSKWFDFSF